MWFGFGLITLLAAFGLNIYTRTRARWSGQQCSLDDGRTYEYQEVRAKGRLQRVRIGVPAPEGFHFLVREEGSHDALFKKIGVCSEMQVRDPLFDNSVYLESDARGLGALLTERHDLRAALLNIFTYANSMSLRRMRVRCAYQRLWLEFSPKDEARLMEAAATLAPKLHVLAEGFRESKASPSDLRDPFVWRAALLLSISTASAMFGVFGMMRALFGRTDILEPWRLFYICLAVGMIAVLGFLVLILGVLGRSSRTHLVLLEVALVGSCGFVLSTYALAREANIDFDRGTATTHVLHDVRAEHRITRGRRGRRNHHYYLHAADWRSSRNGAQVSLEINRTTFDAFADSHNALIRVKPGALGYEWVEDIVPQPQTTPPTPPTDSTTHEPIEAIARQPRIDPEATALCAEKEFAPTPVGRIELPRSNPDFPLTQPEYPLSSRHAGEAGTVVLDTCVLVDGSVGDVRVKRSSGFPRLDEAAVREVRSNWRLRPGSVDGHPSIMWGKFAVTFELSD